MANQLTFFGSIDTENLEEYYEVDIEFNGSTIQIDINFENKTVDNKVIELIEKQLTNIKELNSKNLMEIDKDYNNNGSSFDYADELIDELELNNIEEIITGLHLVRIGFYPEVENTGIVSDYTIGKELTDDLLVVFRKLNGEFDGISIES